MKLIEVTDRRIARTHNLLIEAMIALLGRHEWSKINVQQICDEADIARSTFYSHFDNKQELFDFGFSRLEAHIQKAVAQKATGRSLDENRKFSFLPEILEHIKEHQPIFCGAGAENPKSVTNAQVFAKFKSLIFGFIELEINASSFSKTINKQEVVFISGGIFGIMDAWWANSTKTPIEQVLKSIDNQVERILMG